MTLRTGGGLVAFKTSSASTDSCSAALKRASERSLRVELKLPCKFVVEIPKPMASAIKVRSASTKAGNPRVRIDNGIRLMLILLSISHAF